MVGSFFSSPAFLRLSSGVLRMFFPVLNIGSWTIVSRFDEVKEVLTRDHDFTIAEINAANMHDVDLDFFLGMDASELHDREKAIMESIAKPEDLPFIRTMVAEKTKSLLTTVLKEKKIDVVSHLSRVVPLILIENYFGIPVHNKKKMQEWMRKLFHQLFLNLTHDVQVATEAKQAAAELRDYMTAIIAESEKKFEAGKLQDSTLLYRLLLLQKSNPYVTREFIRKNLSGLMIGAIDTTSKCVVLVLEELLSRPVVLKEAVQADRDKLKSICYEALRFNPHNPIVVRFSKNEMRIGGRSQYRIKANHKIAANIFSAMHDNKAFIRPHEFNWERNNEYLHFGYGLHVCFGRYINAVQIPEIVGGLVRLKNLRKASLNRGKVLYDGPFPNAFWLEFDY